MSSRQLAVVSVGRKVSWIDGGLNVRETVVRAGYDQLYSSSRCKHG
jgi:hypothetical protein